MRTMKLHKCILRYAIVATAALLVLGPGWALAASNQDNQQYQNQQQYQDQGQSNQSYQYQSPSRTTQAQGRDMRLEQQIASRLRQQGYGAQGEIMILATGNRVYLLGNVPDNRTKDGAEKVAKQIASRQSIDNRLHVNAQAKRMSNAELEKDTYDKLGDSLSQDVQVRAQNGTVTLQGQLDNWRQVADAVDAAFAAGATQVNSQFSVAGAGAMAQGGAAYPPYGYAPGQPGQPSYGPRGRPGAMAGREMATGADLQLARQVASQLRQQLPPGQNVQPVPPQSIYVTVQQGTVTLHGYVQNNSEKQQAQQIVQSISGVQNVQNDLAILSTRGTAGQGGGPMGAQQGYGAPSGQGASQQGFGGTSSQSSSQPGYGSMGGASSLDRRLAQNIQRQIQNQLPDASVNVSASQGTVTLRGTVPSNNERQQAEQIAQSASGVQNVQNNLRVSSQGGAFQPQGYIPGQSSQSQQGMSSQNQSSSQSSSQQGFGGGTAGQNQYSQGGQAGAQQGFSRQGQGGQSQFGRGAQAGGAQAGMSASDMAVAQKVVQQLKQKLTGIQNIQIMRPGTIYVMATQGTVMLHGSVQNPSISQQATRIARAIPGVRNIESTLHVSGAGGQAFGYIPGQPQQGQQGAAGQGMQGQNRSTQGSAQMRQIAAPSGQTATGPSSQSDMALAQQVAQRLRQQLTGIQNVQVAQPGTIYVMVSKGTVTLDGLVSNNNMKQKAEQVAKSISGVRSVKNSLSIGAGATSGQAYGYLPPGQDQGASAQFMEDQYGDQQSGNMSGNDQYGNEQFGNDQYGNEQFGNEQPEDEQYGGESFGYMPPNEGESETQPYENEQYGNEQSENEPGSQPSGEGQMSTAQPGPGTH
ncbi:MAG: BON domain-containing protein [Planctomycetes bacterium]|nr:BON domain-containing protein [Planctomycetota bacterium]